MRFITNKLGVVIVLIALVASLFVGVITNTTSETKTVTDYSYVADMSQTFNYSNEPAYLQYNPASNYTGYSLSNEMNAGVAYTEASSPSNYKMITDKSSNTTILEMSDVTSDPTLYRGNSVCIFNNILDIYQSGSPMGWTENWYFMVNPNVISLSGLFNIAKQSAPAGTKTITMRFLSGTTENVSGVGYDINRVVYNNLDYTVMNKLWENTEDYTKEYLGGNYDYWTRSGHYVQTPNDVVYNPSYPITFNIQTNSATVNRNGAISPIDMATTYVLWKSSGDVINRTYDHPPGSSGSYSTRTINADWTTRVYLTFDAYQQTYIKINDGVRINNTDTSLTTNWSNGNDNGVIDIVFGKNNDTGMENTFTLNYDGDTDPQFTLSRYANGNVTLQYGGELYTIGTWDYFLLRFNAMEGWLAAYPVTSFTNYTQFTASGTQLILDPDYDPESQIPTGALAIPTGVIQGITWNAVSMSPTSFTFSVSDTTIRDTFQLLMVNPSINIADYFIEADNDGWRLNFYSFATYGDSITINGRTFPVADGKITVNDRSYKLTNIYVSYDDLTGHIYLTFVNDRITIDLGDRTTSVVSMSGTWFFSTAYYEADITQRTETNIQWTRLPPMGTVSLVFIGITLLLSAVAIKKLGFTLPDYIVTVTSVAVAFCLMEVFI